MFLKLFYNFAKVDELFFNYGNPETTVFIELEIPYNCWNARSIKNVSEFQNEDEVLLPSYTGVYVIECDMENRYLKLQVMQDNSKITKNNLGFSIYNNDNKFNNNNNISMPQCLNQLMAIGGWVTKCKH